MADFSFSKDVKILDNLPNVLVDIDEIKAIANVEDPILSGQWDLLTQALNDQFVITTDENGIARYEKMLKLTRLASDTLETRILRVLTKYQEQAPYTWIVLNNILKSLLGESAYSLERDVANKVLTVKLQLTIKNQFDILVALLERIVPQNMILNVELRFNTWSQVRPMTWQQVKARTWGDIKEGIL